jgi:hypothetical protein
VQAWEALIAAAALAATGTAGISSATAPPRLATVSMDEADSAVPFSYNVGSARAGTTTAGGDSTLHLPSVGQLPAVGGGNLYGYNDVPAHAAAVVSGARTAAAAYGTVGRSASDDYAVMDTDPAAMDTQLTQGEAELGLSEQAAYTGALEEPVSSDDDDSSDFLLMDLAPPSKPQHRDFNSSLPRAAHRGASSGQVYAPHAQHTHNTDTQQRAAASATIDFQNSCEWGAPVRVRKSADFYPTLIRELQGTAAGPQAV